MLSLYDTDIVVCTELLHCNKVFGDPRIPLSSNPVLHLVSKEHEILKPAAAALIPCSGEYGSQPGLSLISLTGKSTPPG